MKILSLVSSNPQNRHLFQVDSTGTLLAFTERDGTPLSFYVGKMGTAFTETYLRPAESDDVFLVEGITSHEAHKELKAWRDKTIAPILRDSVTSLTFRYPKERFTLLRGPKPGESIASTWSMQPPTKEQVGESSVSVLLNSLEGLRAEDFVDSTVKLPSPQLTLDVTMHEPITLQFIPVPPDSAKYWVKSSTTDQLFTANKWNVQPILKKQTDFLLK